VPRRRALAMAARDLADQGAALLDHVPHAPGSDLTGDGHPIAALTRRREVEHAPAASLRLAAEARIGVHGDRLAHQPEERDVAAVVAVEDTVADTHAELARDRAGPVHLPLVDAERIAEPPRQYARFDLGLDGSPAVGAERPRDRRDQEIHPA